MVKKLVCIALLIALGLPTLFIQGQADRDCGVIEGIDYPIDGISIEHDDFGMYRGGYGGYHSGIDMAFERYGEPIRAAARGRVTFSDTAGWGDEKGVVVIEHTLPDRTSVFSLYGHMEETPSYRFPSVGECIERGEIIGVVGAPKSSAKHLHYEIRTMRASTGGPGYWDTDPLSGGWLHPIEFTEQWRLRLSPAFQGILTASSVPVAAPLWAADGSAILATQTQIESRIVANNGLSIRAPQWVLRVEGMIGIAPLTDGRIIGSTINGQVYVFDKDRFAASWRADRPLRTPPLRVGNSIVFLDSDNRALSVVPETGAVLWQTEPLGKRIEHHAVSGDLLAVATERDGSYEIVVLNPAGQIVYAGRAPAPIMPSPLGGGFLIMVSTQVSLLSPSAVLTPLLDTGIGLARSAQVAVDPIGSVYIYPGYGQEIYAFAPGGGLRWRSRLPSVPVIPPKLAVGDGCLLYVLTADGSLLAFRATDGALSGLASLYGGGRRRQESARVLTILPGEQVIFSAGYLSTAIIHGMKLANLSECRTP
ncbi:MAG: hypothetical protein OHK0023_28390 [Anaerolineae bacterium]